MTRSSNSDRHSVGDYDRVKQVDNVTALLKQDIPP